MASGLPTRGGDVGSALLLQVMSHTNPQKAKAYWARYHRKHRARICARARKRYSAKRAECLAKVKRRASANPDKVKANQLRVRYGITLNEYKRLHRLQRGRCAICRGKSSVRGRDLSVDHCHRTGRVRGLLCAHCNFALGLFKDSLDILRRAEHYLSCE